MKVVILQSNYIPWKGYFDLIYQADVFVFYDCVKYTKNDWRNRNIIYSKNGKQWLTIPVKASSTNLKIEEVTINHTNWQQLHFKTLLYAYKKAPFFEQLEELMEDYLQDHQWEYLSDLNQYLIKKISFKLEIDTIFRQASEFDLSGDKVERLLSVLNALNASEYISGSAALDYLQGQEDTFLQKGIQLTFRKYPDYPNYLQFSNPFENSVSILDMIAHIEWKDIKNYIWVYEK